MKKIFLSFLLVMAGISHTLAQGLDGNVEQRLKDFLPGTKHLMPT